MPLEDLSTPQAVLVKEGLELWSRRPSSQSSIDKLIDENVIQKFCSQQYKFALCTLIHPETPSCTGYGLLVWFTGLILRSAGLYAPLNAIMILVYSWKKMLKQPHTYLLRFIKSTIRSSLFLSLYVTIAWVSTCYQRRLLGRDKLPIYFINGMLSGLCVLIEPPGRRLELGLYVMPRALESAYKCLVQYRYIPSPFGEPLYFCLATGVLMALYETEQDSITDGYRKVLVRLFGVN
ncbi:hypothetical protein BKA69DRAFT_1024262 [Paraphysoderma sedebokerense]|nr:hypothetical protein BKA69DRAFT_1024262 [Paraphysoderma sedebokerense]